MLSIWLSLGLLGTAWECGNTGQWDALHQTDKYISTPGPYIRSSEWWPLRMHIRPISTLDGETAKMLTETIHWFSGLLSVRRLKEPLRSEGCAEYGVAGLGEKYETDFVLYVLLGQGPSQYAARTVLCSVEGGNSLGAPLSGLVLLYPHTGTSLAAVLRHEISHLLAISTFLFPRYRSQTGSVYVQPLVWAKVRNETVPVLRTPTVVERARKALNCAEATGVELDIDRDGAIEAHWTGRMMHMDYMLSNVSDLPVYSAITLAAFEDSGWYRVQPNAGSRLPFGYQRGCGFLTSPCVTDQKARFPEFCDIVSGDLCTADLRFKATCGLRRYPSPLPPSYQWFSDPFIGGFSQSLEYCPVPVPDLDGDCSGKGAISSLINTEAYGELACPSCLCLTGSYIKPQWSLKGMPVHSGCHRVECNREFATVHIGTEAVQCPKEGGVVAGLKEFIGNVTCPRYNLMCPEAQCPSHCSGNGMCTEKGCECISGYYGAGCELQCHITCSQCYGPLATQCLSCYSQSILSPSRTCECPSSLIYSPENKDCVWDSVTCHPQCMTCSGPLVNDCLSCMQSAHVDISGVCSCDVGLVWEAGKCVPCAPSCSACSGPAESQCTQCFANAQLSSGYCQCDSGFFPDIAGCSPCHFLCLTCVSDEAESCTSCKADSAILLSGRCTCLEGFFLTVTGGNCSPCHPTCASCYGPGAYHCIICGAFSVLESVSNQCKCQEGFSRSPDLSACQSSSPPLPCVPNFTPLSVLFLLFFVQLFTGRRFVHQEQKSLPQPVSVATELPLLHSSGPVEVPAALYSANRGVGGRGHWVFRLGVLMTVLIWGGFVLELLYYLSYSDPEDETKAKGSIWTFNINDSAYILATFVLTFSLNYLLFRLYLAYRVSGKHRQLCTAVGTALGLSVVAIVGTALLAAGVCEESGGLWMCSFYVLLGLEVCLSQSVLRALSQSLP